MKKLLPSSLLASSLLALGLLAGCQDPIPAWQNPNAPLQVTMDNNWLQNELYVQLPKPERVGAGQLKVTLQLYNRTGDDMTVDYKYFFTDKAGNKVEDPISTGWEAERVPAHGSQSISFTSLSAAADDFRVEIRSAK